VIPRDWTCFQCGSRWITDAAGELVEMSPTEICCLGCDRLLDILQRSSVLKASLPPEPEPAQELTPSAILTRLLSGRDGRADRDWAKQAANDREE
jgi:hypothetical protein